MKKELLPQRKIGEFLSIGVEMEKEEYNGPQKLDNMLSYR